MRSCVQLVTIHFTRRSFSADECISVVRSLALLSIDDRTSSELSFEIWLRRRVIMTRLGSGFGLTAAIARRDVRSSLSWSRARARPRLHSGRSVLCPRGPRRRMAGRQTDAQTSAQNCTDSVRAGHCLRGTHATSISDSVGFRKRLNTGAPVLQRCGDRR